MLFGRLKQSEIDNYLISLIKLHKQMKESRRNKNHLFRNFNLKHF